MSNKLRHGRKNLNRAKVGAKERTIFELQREIDSLRIKVGQLEEVSSLRLLASNRLVEFNEVVHNYTTLLAQQLVVELSFNREKKCQGNHIELYRNLLGALRFHQDG